MAVRAMPLHPEVGVGAQRRVPIQHFLALFGLEPQSAGNCVPWAVGAGAADGSSTSSRSRGVRPRQECYSYSTVAFAMGIFTIGVIATLQ